MPARPDDALDALALRLVNALDGQRRKLIRELADFEPATETTAVLSLVMSDRFLAQDLRRGVREAVEKGTTEQVRVELQGLVVDGRTREAARSLVAYFLKYRYLELTDVRLDDASGLRTLTRTWDLPAGHESLYQDVRELHRRTGDESRPPESPMISMLPSRVTSAPWLGALRPRDILEAVAWLVQLGLLEFAQDDDIPIDEPQPTVPVLRLTARLVLVDEEVGEDYHRAREAARLDERRRRNTVRDRGIGVRAVGAAYTYRLIEESDSNDVLKIATYHLRTVVGERDLVDWLHDKTGLRIQVLCLGPTKEELLTEGADETSLLRSLARGISGFQQVLQDLPPERRRQVQVRVYGDAVEHTYFRGAILCTGDAGRKPKRIVATVWLPGVTRGNYGEIVELDGRSNVAGLLDAYFNTAWENSVPLLGLDPRRTLTWVFRALGNEVLASLFLALVAAVILLIQPDWGGDAFFVLVATIPVLIVAFARVGGRAFRTLHLSALIRAGSGK